ncbi:MAG: S-layer homology domain-containing protein [Clostridium sp.]|nr:S-layer homology domain-containing protein [Clostridium sp.]
MNINNIKVYIIAIALIFSVKTQNVGAHGALYELKQIDEKKVRITLKLSESGQNRGIIITHYYLVNGKVLHIGYETKDGAENEVYLDYDMSGAVPPIRIKLTNINDRDWVPFNDIKGIEQEEYITHLHDVGIVNGMPDGSFKPYSKITRAEFMVLIVKALNISGTAENMEGFTDIEGHWAKDIILIALKCGLISGYGDKTIRPDNPISLAEVSSVISRAFEFKTAKNGIYQKLKKDRWYSSSVKRMFDVGILSVDDSLYKDFNEEGLINRADCSMMISRALSTY